MKKTRIFLIAPAVLAGAVLLLNSCSKTSIEPVDEIDAAVTKYIPSNFGVYTIKQSGTYKIKGTVTGQYIDVKAADVTIIGEGSNPTFKGKGYSGQARSASHIRGGGNKLTVKDFTFVGRVGHNFMSVNSKNTLIQNLKVYNNTKAGAGAINPGPNSMVKNCYIEPHDDAIKVTEEYSKAENNVCKMDGNGSVIQLGWGLRANGPVHYAKNTKVSGYLTRNKQTNTDNNPGRAIVGGIFENKDIRDIKITGLDINMSSKHTAHYVKLRANGGVAKNIVISGVIRNTVKVASGIKPVALSTGKGGKLQNVTIDFGSKIKSSDVYKDAGVTGLKIGGGGNNGGGGSGGSCDNNTAPKGNIVKTDYNGKGDGRVIVSASDNSKVVRVEVFKGNASMGKLTSPNAGSNYRIVNAKLDKGNAFSVVIKDDCGAKKTLNGTMP